MVEKRKLRKEEILKIIEWLTPKIFNSQFPEVSKDLANGWRRILYNQLADEKFDPSKIDFITEEIKETFLKKMIPPGTPVGKIAGTSVGEKATQFILKLKSNASTSSSGTSVKVSTLFRNLIDAPKNPAHQQIEIRFAKKVKLIDLYLRRREFQRLHLDADDFIISSDIIYAEDNISDWYDQFEEIYGYGATDITSTLGLQIRFDVQKLYDHRLTLAEIAESLLEESRYIRVFFSPQELGTIDIYLNDDYEHDPNFTNRISLLESKTEVEIDDGWELDDEEDITEDEISYSRSRSRHNEEGRDEDILEDLEDIDLSEQDRETLYLETIIRPLLSVKNFGGKDSIKEVFIAWTPYASTINKVKKVGTDYIIQFNQKVLKHTGITEREILDWFRSENWEVVHEKGLEYRFSKEGGKSPTEELLDAMQDSERFESVVQVFLEASSGFAELVVHPDVDTDHSYTNSSQIMKEIYGVEVARKVMSNMANEILGGDHYVSPVHPELIIHFMTFTGDVMPMTHVAFRYLKTGALEQAMFERQLPAITKAAMYPTSESVRRPTTASVFGSAPPIGTGSVTVFETKDYVEMKRQRELEETVSKEYERRKLLQVAEELEAPEEYEPFELDFEIPEVEFAEVPSLTPKILLPSEISEEPSPSEPEQVVPSDSLLSSTVEVLATGPTRPIAQPPRVIRAGPKRTLKMK